MKGIKTAVKTEWKNYAHGNTRGPIRMDKSEPLYISGVKAGEYIVVTYHIEWGGVDWGRYTNVGYNMQMQNTTGYAWLGFETADASGAMNVKRIIHLTKNAKNEDITDTDVFQVTCPIQYFTIKDDGYIKISNFMTSLGTKPLPYIDSDELKASGGAIVRFLSAVILNLAYAGRKEAA